MNLPIWTFCNGSSYLLAQPFRVECAPSTKDKSGRRNQFFLLGVYCKFTLNIITNETLTFSLYSISAMEKKQTS